MIKRTVSTFGLALVACLHGQTLLAVQHCGAQDFKGTYGIVAHGAVTVPGFPITGPFARAGQVIADGNGKLVFNTTASYNGFLFEESIYATYVVSPDCGMVFTVEPFAPIFQNATFRALLSDNKRQVNFMITEPLGQTISAVLKKQDAGFCTEKDLAGSYDLHLTGNIVTPPAGLLPGQFVRVGRFVPDGNGHFSATTNANYNGFLIRAEELSGTYTMAANCTVRMLYTYENVPYIWNGALTDNSKGVDLVVANDGFAISGELTQQ